MSEVVIIQTPEPEPESETPAEEAAESAEVAAEAATEAAETAEATAQGAANVAEIALAESYVTADILTEFRSEVVSRFEQLETLISERLTPVSIEPAVEPDPTPIEPKKVHWLTKIPRWLA